MKALLAASLFFYVTLPAAWASDPQSLTLATFVEKWNASLYKAEPVTPWGGMLPELLSCPPSPVPVLVYELPGSHPISLDPRLVARHEWQACWWEYGGALALSLRQGGLQEEALWRIIAPTPCLERPAYQPWITFVSYRTEKSGAITQVVSEYRRCGDQLRFRNPYNLGCNEQSAWTYELEPQFTRKNEDCLPDQFPPVLIHLKRSPRSFLGEQHRF